MSQTPFLLSRCVPYVFQLAGFHAEEMTLYIFAACVVFFQRIPIITSRKITKDFSFPYPFLSVPFEPTLSLMPFKFFP